MKKYFRLIACIFLLYSSYLFAYDEEATHRNITLQAAGDPKTGKLTNYLKQNLGFEGGLETKLPSDESMTVLKWLQEGSFEEDQPICRRSNHFHNPLKPWDESYMDDDTSVDGVLIRGYCGVRGWPYSERKSNVTWGTGYLSRNQTTPPLPRNNQDMGWDNARQYYYWGLTSISDTGRELFFAKTFRALGQVLHLLQDVSVPAHVRNDFTSHEVFLGMESLDPIIFLSNRFEHYLQYKNTLIFNTTPDFPSFTNPRVTDFWDTEQYLGNNPSRSLSLGLAEFANANYFSDWTIPNNNPTAKHIFTHPKVDNTNTRICEDYAQNSTEIRKYISKEVCLPLSQERKTHHFAAISLVNEESMITNENIPSLKLALDENVHDTYAKEILPRAVGYSAGLLDYFFRGELRVTPMPVIEGNQIRSVKVKIKNMTANEAMSGGEFTLTYRYSDGSQDIWGQAPVVASGNFAYGEERLFEFSLPIQIPVENASSAKFTLAFRGTLEGEQGAVIGKAFSLGEIKFNEDWDNGLNGNHNWAHTDFNYFDQDPTYGISSNVIENGVLIKDNIKYTNNPWPHTNDSFLSCRVNNGQFRDILPIRITPQTYLQIKIDEISINQIPPAPPGETNQWQYFVLRFTNGLDLQITRQGDGVYLGDNIAYWSLPIGEDYVYNIYEMFRENGFTISGESMDLDHIGFAQVLWNPPTDMEYHQRMKIDYIRIIEMKEQ